MAEHPARQYYQQVVGEYFNGEFIGQTNWCKIKIDEESLTEKMKDALREIKKYEGIWKGYEGGILFTKCEEDTEYLQKASKFKIINWDCFETWRERDKYADKRGFFFVVKTVN